MDSLRIQIHSWTEADDFTETEKFCKEQELIGVGISPHPLQTLAKTSPISDHANH